MKPIERDEHKHLQESLAIIQSKEKDGGGKKRDRGAKRQDHTPGQGAEQPDVYSAFD